MTSDPFFPYFILKKDQNCIDFFKSQSQLIKGKRKSQNLKMNPLEVTKKGLWKNPKVVKQANVGQSPTF